MNHVWIWYNLLRMSFTAFEFLPLVAATFALYWSVAAFGAKAQNLILILASTLFYAAFNPHFCLMLFAEALLAYLAGLAAARSHSKFLMPALIVVLLAPLAVFKYCNFFVDSFVTFLPSNLQPPIFNLILPVGISFYTFMAVGYVIDVRRKTIGPERDPFRFLAFMTFFPQLTAGPIGRAPALLPQFEGIRRFDRALAVDGCRRILWGAFKKLVVADLAAAAVAPVFDRPSAFGAATLWLGALVFTIQIYADFSGYSDMAIGIGRLFGIRLAENFRLPYFATNIADFWRRWHMSLTTWFRDYVYFPLGGSRCAKAKVVRNTLIVFLVSGLWHGAAWTFVLWGFIHGLFFLPKLCLRPVRLPPAAKWLLTFTGVMLAWILFRAPDFASAAAYFKGLVTPGGNGAPGGLLDCLPYAAIMFAAEGWKRNCDHPLDLDLPKALRWTLYFALIILIFFARPQNSQFIYAQF